MKKYIFFLSILFCLTSCVKDEGEGGTSVVDGYVYKILHPDGIYSFETDTIPASRTDVYIQYGNQKPYGDKMDAGPDGYFRFKYLTKGTYTVFAYNEYPDGLEEAVYETVHVGGGSTATTNNIYIHEGKMFGKSYIKGVLLADYYDKDELVAKNVPAVEQRVYIQKKGVSFPFSDVRTGADGTFIFEKLPVGEFQIYGICEDSDRVIYVDKLIDVVITEKESIVELKEPIVIRLRS